MKLLKTISLKEALRQQNVLILTRSRLRRRNKVHKEFNVNNIPLTFSKNITLAWSNLVMKVKYEQQLLYMAASI